MSPRPRPKNEAVQPPAGRPLEARLTLLGSWDLSVAGRSLPVPLNGQRLIALLALKGRLHRAYVAGMLWPDVLDEQAASRLRSTLWRLHQQDVEVVCRDTQRLWLTPELVIDVHEARSLAQGLSSRDTALEDVVDQAATLAELPELLLGWYEDWVAIERERLSQLQLQALEALTDRLCVAGETSAALTVATAAVHLDPLRESSHRAVIQAHLAAGNSASAKQQYDRYRTLMKNEFGIEHPSRQMLDAIATISDL